MVHAQLQNFLSFLAGEGYLLFAPTKSKKQRGESPATEIKPVEDFKNFQFAAELPLHSFKHFLVPAEETLFTYKGDKMKMAENKPWKQVLVISVLDLKALLLWNQEYEKDPYYQERLRNTLIIGYSFVPGDKEQNFFHTKYEEDILEHLQFDIFFEVLKFTPLESNLKHKVKQRKVSLNRNLASVKEDKFLTGEQYFVYSGSEKGQEALENFSAKGGLASGEGSGYENIQFVGPIKEEGKDARMLQIRDKMVNHNNPKIWEDLNKICLECGKCAVVCPTCFCFDLRDEPGMKPGEGKRQRCSDTCFYSDFSMVAGGKKGLNNAGERIHFWYYHKFARIPDEFGFSGCIGCGRCSRVCPVGIDIAKNIEKILAG